MTYAVSELTGEIRDFLGEAFAFVWVVGEAQRVRASQRGHLYFELVEKGRGDRVIGKLDAVMWRTTHQRVRRRLAASGQELAEGQQIRCFGRLDFYGPAGRLQLIVSEVDPLFTLGLLERRRRETLAALASAGLLERNQRLPLPTVPLRIGLVTSEGSAAYHDFLTGLAESGFGFQVLFVHAAVQGSEAEREVSAAIRVLSRDRLASRLDAIAVIRGGGARTDLAAFDSRRIAETIARCPVPVLTGLGHETDRSIADLASHSAFKTPTKVAEFLAVRVADADRRVEVCGMALSQLAQLAVARAEERVRRLERLPRSADLYLRRARLEIADKSRAFGLFGRRRLAEASRSLDTAARRLVNAAPRLLERRRTIPEVVGQRLVVIAGARLREMRATIDGFERLCVELAPERILERGFSITRDAAGKILTHPDKVQPGETVTTRLAGGVLHSRVEGGNVEDSRLEDSRLTDSRVEES